MAIDKRINYIGGGEVTDTYQGGSGAPGSAEAGKAVGSVGGPSYDSGPDVNYGGSERDFIQTLNNNNFIRANQTGKKFSPFNPNPRGSGLSNLVKTLFGFAVPGSSFLFNEGIGKALGKFRKDFTGYDTQEEYENAKQQRINLGRINTIQNTLDTKYEDGDYTMTDLDERLAGLQRGLGIVPNTSAQNTQQFLDFSNLPELQFEGIQTLAQPNINSSLPMGVAPNNYNRQFIEPLAPNLEDPVKDQVGSIENLMAKLSNFENREYNTLKTGKELGMNSEEQNQRLQELEEKKNEAMLSSSTMFS